MRDPNETITSRIRRADLAPLLDAMAGAERQRITAPMMVAVPPEATRSDDDTPSVARPPVSPAGRKRAHTVAGKVSSRPRIAAIPPLATSSTTAPKAEDADVDAAFDAAIDEMRDDERAQTEDDVTTQPITFTSHTDVDVVVRFASGTTSSQRYESPTSSPTSSQPGAVLASQPSLTFDAATLQPRMPRWVIVAMSCVLTLVIAGLLVAAA